MNIASHKNEKGWLTRHGKKNPKAWKLHASSIMDVAAIAYECDTSKRQKSSSN